VARSAVAEGGCAGDPGDEGEVIRDDFLIFGRPDIGEEEIAEVVDTLRSGWIGTGPRTERFERLFAEYVGAPHAVAVSSGTAALHLSLLAAGIGECAEVITTPMTFCSTANAIVHAGATPVFADVDPATGNLDPDLVAAAVTDRTAAILPVHYAGRPCRMDALKEIAASRGLLVIEDGAHAIGGALGGKRVGAIGDATCFSFYVTKNLVTGEGGMVTTDDEELESRIRRLSLHGMSRDAWQRFSVDTFHHYEVTEPGFKSNMTDIQAAMGIHQLAKVDRGLERRREIWSAYDAGLAGLPLQLPAPEESDAVHARHLYTVLVDTDRSGKSRDHVLDDLIEHRIGTGVHYRPVHLHPWYRERFGHGEGDFPNAERIGARTLSLPLSAGLTDRDVADVVEAVNEVVSRAAAREGA
jgi:dTDP-4-amino-4,6-dideoxygalactose transaminase